MSKVISRLFSFISAGITFQEKQFRDLFTKWFQNLVIMYISLLQFLFITKSRALSSRFSPWTCKNFDESQWIYNTFSLGSQYSEDENKEEFETRDLNHNGQLEKVRFISFNRNVKKFGQWQYHFPSYFLRQVHKQDPMDSIFVRCQNWIVRTPLNWTSEGPNTFVIELESFCVGFRKYQFHILINDNWRSKDLKRV